MPRPVKDAKLDSRTARSALKARGKPYWRAIDHDLHLGYRRNKTGGRWVARVYLGGQRYRIETIGTADDRADADGLITLDWRQAQAKARKFQLDLARVQAGLEEPSAYTVEDAITAYAAWLEAHGRRSALRDLETANRVHIRPALGAIELAKLSKDHLAGWHQGLARKPARVRTRAGAGPRYRKLGDDPESQRRRRDTANRTRTVLFAALNRAFQDGKVASDAAWRAVRSFRGTTAARVRYLSPDECRRLLNASAPDLRDLVRGALLTGARYSELCAADCRDFDRDATALLIRQSKSGKARWIPLDGEGVRFLVGLTAGRCPDDPIFIRTDGKRWKASNADRPLRSACQAARLEPASFHVFRHTWASLRIMSGMPLLVAAQVLGHADTRQVERHYGHLARSFVQAAVQATAIDLGPVESNIATLRRGDAA